MLKRASWCLPELFIAVSKEGLYAICPMEPFCGHLGIQTPPVYYTLEASWGITGACEGGDECK